MAQLANHRAAVARASLALKRSPDDPTLKDHLTQSRVDLAEAKIVDYIERTVAAAPPLSHAQRSRLALLLAPAENTQGMHNRDAA